MKITREVTVDVRITDEIRESVKKQYPNSEWTDKEIAEVIADTVIGNGIEKANFGGCYWDGVARLQGNITEYNIEED